MRRLFVIVLAICCVYGICGCQPAGQLTPEDRKVRAIVTRLSSRNRAEWIGAAEELADIGPDAHFAVPFLVRKLRVGRVDLKIAVMRALGRIGPASRVAIPILMEYLDSQDHLASLSAAAALGEIGPDARPAVPRLAQMLEWNRMDEGWGSELARGLGNIGPHAAPAAATMIRVFKARQDQATGRPNVKYDGVSRQIALALGRIGPPARAAIPVLVEALQAENPDMRKAAAAGLAGIGGPYGSDAVAVLIRAIETPLAEIGAARGKAPSALGAAYRRLDRQATARQEMIPLAMVALAKDPNAQQAIPAIIAVLKMHPVARYREAAARCLGRIIPSSRFAVAALRVALMDTERSVASAAALVLAKIEPSDRNITRIMELIAESPSMSDRLKAIDILAELGPAAEMSLPALDKVLKGNSPTLSQAAARAIEKINQTPATKPKP